MSSTLACIAGSAIYRLQEQGLLPAREIGRQKTPFGASEVIYLVEETEAPYYLLPRHGAGKYRLSSAFANHRADLYALKDLGVQSVVSWTAAGAISHNYNVGDLVLVNDVIDRTTHRATTFFQNTGIGVLRQFPVFCPHLREGLAQSLQEMDCQYRPTGTLVVTEGPRLETPAEVRFFASAGGELISHNFAPEAFLAKELELCYAGLAYIVNYAETGSRYRPFSANDLFGGLAASADTDRVTNAVSKLSEMTSRLSQYVASHPLNCECRLSMRYEVNKHSLPEDWRQWFSLTGARGEPAAPQP